MQWMHWIVSDFLSFSDDRLNIYVQYTGTKKITICRQIYVRNSRNLNYLLTKFFFTRCIPSVTWRIYSLYIVHILYGSNTSRKLKKIWRKQFVALSTYTVKKVIDFFRPLPSICGHQRYFKLMFRLPKVSLIKRIFL